MPKRDVAPNGAPCWIELFTTDTDAAESFYGEIFGWTAEHAGEEYGGYINFSKDGAKIAGMMKSDGSHAMPVAWGIYLATDDIAATADAAAANGGQVFAPPMQVMDLGHMAVFGDPGGASIGAWQPGEHKGFELIAEDGAPSWFELHTKAYDTSVAFYHDVFGWDTNTMSDTPEFRYTTLGKDEGALAGVMDAAAFLPDDVASSWAVYIQVSDADATAATITKLGGTIIDEPQDTPYGRLATATDPTGARFKLMGPTA